MFLPTFCQGQCLTLLPLYNEPFNDIINRKLSIELVVQYARCTWNLLQKYNYENMCNLRPNVRLSMEMTKDIKNVPCTLMNNLDRYFDYYTKEMHIMSMTITISTSSAAQEIYTAPAVSIEAGLELFKPRNIEINHTENHVFPFIFDTGASLVITGE